MYYNLVLNSELCFRISFILSILGKDNFPKVKKKKKDDWQDVFLQSICGTRRLKNEAYKVLKKNQGKDLQAEKITGQLDLTCSK